MTRAKDQAPRILEMRQQGMTWTAIGKALGMHPDTAQYASDEGYAEERRRRNTMRRRERYVAPKIHRPERPTMSREEAAAAIASVPRDTRGLTARLLGDPLPGRSALDRKGARP